MRRIAPAGLAGFAARIDVNLKFNGTGKQGDLGEYFGLRSRGEITSPTKIMEREQKKNDLIGFLRTIQRPDYPNGEIDEDSSLIESGLIDSLALLQIVTYLEQAYAIDFRETGIDPAELRSVSSILDLIDRELKS